MVDIFVYEEDGSLSIEGAVYQSIGAASTCWENMESTGTFNSARALTIGESLLEFIKNYYEGGTTNGGPINRPAGGDTELLDFPDAGGGEGSL